MTSEWPKATGSKCSVCLFLVCSSGLTPILSGIWRASGRGDDGIGRDIGCGVGPWVVPEVGAAGWSSPRVRKSQKRCGQPHLVQAQAGACLSAQDSRGLCSWDNRALLCRPQACSRTATVSTFSGNKLNEHCTAENQSPKP